MKLILSRKGFDSKYGGVPSPILPNGTLIPFPIPSQYDDQTFKEIDYYGIQVDSLISDLSKGKHSLNTKIHIDPDLYRPPHNTLPKGWRPSLGQTGNAQSHLKKMGVGKGDVFLFFGWFKEIERINERWQYSKEADDIHVIFGWIEVATALPIVTHRESCLNEFPWISAHPHMSKPVHYSDSRNTLYVAECESRYCNEHNYGGGKFKKYSELLRLTKKSSTRSIWDLPGWFFPQPDQEPLTYHPRDRWHMEGERVTLSSAAIGQEFVLDCESYDEADDWIKDIVSENISA